MENGDLRDLLSQMLNNQTQDDSQQNDNQVFDYRMVTEDGSNSEGLRVIKAGKDGSNIKNK